MIKPLLKAIFPRAFLKQCFVLYNRVRRSTIDKLLFREVGIDKARFALYDNKYPFQINQVSVEDLKGTPAYNYMKDWLTWSQEEFLLEFNKPCWIEPEYGWAMMPPNYLIYESIAFSRTDHQRKPDLVKFWRRKHTRSFSKIVSLRDSGEENYFHFYNDVLSKIFFLKEQGVQIEQLPVVVSAKLWDKPYFKFILSQSEYLNKLNWVVQDSDYIYCESAIFCKPLTHRSDLWKEVTATLITRLPKLVTRKVFLTRQKARLRFIENGVDIEAISRSRGYEIVDTDVLTPAQQIELFSTISHLVGIHGAGLTNMAFCPPGCRVLELFPPPDLGYLPYHYILLAKIKRFSYRALIGSPPDMRFSGGFKIDADKFTEALKELDS
jgi:hypothetical protein